jgi:hypothetical protein
LLGVAFGTVRRVFSPEIDEVEVAHIFTVRAASTEFSADRSKLAEKLDRFGS